MANIVCKSWKVVKVETKSCYWKCCLCLSNSHRQQIKLHPTRWHYPLITYPTYVNISTMHYILSIYSINSLWNIWSKKYSNKCVQNTYKSCLYPTWLCTRNKESWISLNLTYVTYLIFSHIESLYCTVQNKRRAMFIRFWKRIWSRFVRKMKKKNS